jgi:hypothetical protein
MLRTAKFVALVAMAAMCGAISCGPSPYFRPTTPCYYMAGASTQNEGGKIEKTCSVACDPGTEMCHNGSRYLCVEVTGDCECGDEWVTCRVTGGGGRDGFYEKDGTCKKRVCSLDKIQTSIPIGEIEGMTGETADEVKSVLEGATGCSAAEDNSLGVQDGTLRVHFPAHDYLCQGSAK